MRKRLNSSVFSYCYAHIAIIRAVLISAILILASCSSNPSRIHNDDYFILDKKYRYDEVVYQFDWSRSFDGWYLISIRANKKEAFLKFVGIDRFSSQKRKFEKKLTQKELKSFFEFVAKTGFWSSVSPKAKEFGEHAFRCSFENGCDMIVQLDGSVWRIDALHEGNRHTVEDMSPMSGIVREMGDYFINLVRDDVRGDIY